MDEREGMLKGKRQPGKVELAQEVREAAATILRMIEQTGPPPGVTASLRVTCEEAKARMKGERLTVALVGDAGAGRRTLYNALLGARVLTTGTPRRGSTVTIVRRAPLGFVAQSLEGRCVANLARKLPDRDALFSRSLEQMQREMAATEALATRQEVAQARADAARTSIAIRDDLRAAVGLATTPEHAPVARAWASAARLWKAIRFWLQSVWTWLMQRTRLPTRGTHRLAPGATSGPLIPVATGTEEASPSPDEQSHSLDERRKQETVAVCAREGDGALTTSEQIEARMERLRMEQRTYEGERRAAFLTLVREVEGTDIAERIIEYPAERLASNLTLVDLPCPNALNASAVAQAWSRIAREADALVLVIDIQRPLGSATASLVLECKETVPLVLVVLTKADGALADMPSANGDMKSRISQRRIDALRGVAESLGIQAEHMPCIVTAAEAALDNEKGSPEREQLAAMTNRLSEWLCDARPSILAWREAMRMRAGASELVRAGAEEEVTCRERLAALEQKPIPDPAVFRGRLLGRVEGAIAKGAGDVLAGARLHLHEEFEKLRAQWQTQIASCAARGEVEACAKAINEGAPKRITDALERTAEHVAHELQELSETLERWALDEIHTQYQLVKSLSVEVSSPVASELTRDDLAQQLFAVKPAEGALDAFERQRVNYGLGGVAAGAVLGTLIAPGVGTAVGAVLGVFAGLLKGVDSLKEECADTVLKCLDDAEKYAHTQLVNKGPEFSRVVRITLDGALEEALGRLSDAINRLMAVERETMERERSKLDSLKRARLALEKCDTELASLMAKTSWWALSPGDSIWGP